MKWTETESCDRKAKEENGAKVTRRPNTRQKYKEQVWERNMRRGREEGRKDGNLKTVKPGQKWWVAAGDKIRNPLATKNNIKIFILYVWNI